MYDPLAYGLAIALVEMPYLLVQACVFVPIMYWMVAFEAKWVRGGRGLGFRGPGAWV